MIFFASVIFVSVIFARTCLKVPVITNVWGREREGAVGHGQRAVDSVQWTVCSGQCAVGSWPWWTVGHGEHLAVVDVGIQWAVDS